MNDQSPREFGHVPPSADPFADDPDLGTDPGAPEIVAPTTELEEIAAELAQAAFAEETEIDTSIPGYSVVYRTDFGLPDVEKLKSKAKDPQFRRSNDGVNPAKHAALVLAVMCKRIRRHGVDLDLGDGQAVTFTTPAFKELLGLPSGASAAVTVQKFLGGDYRVLRASDALMVAAGVADVADPT